MQPLFFMNDRHRYYRRILRAIKTVDTKCDKTLGMLNTMLGKEEDSLIESLRKSARDMYQSSLEERRRTGGFFNVHRHD